MVEMDGGPSSKPPPPPPPPISDMLQKFAVAFKNKTYELFSEEYSAFPSADSDFDVTLLLDSAEEFIPDQKVVVIKPDPRPGPRCSTGDLRRALIPSLFSTLSSFEASYLQFQAAHVPEINQNALQAADKSIVSILQKLTDMKNLYRDSKKGSGSGRDFDFPAGSFLEFQVQENQSKLRVLETIVNSLQSQMDVKDDEASHLRNKLDKIRASNADVSPKLAVERGNSGLEVLLTIRVFQTMLGDSVKSVRRFVKLLIDLMQRDGWDLEKAANSFYSGVNYSKNGHFRYAFLSYVCLRMFHNLDTSDFGLSNSEMFHNLDTNVTGNVVDDHNGYLRQLIGHIATDPMETLSKKPKCEFSRFCDKKYEELIHPSIEYSIFKHLERKDKVSDSWKPLAIFHELFVRMASSVWLLHKLAYSFTPSVEIFRVDRGAEYSMVYMEDILGSKCVFSGKSKSRVEFTVVPGFKVGKTVIQSQVYLADSKSADK